jgi:hypothetical protein
VPITITRFGVPACEQTGGISTVPVAIYPEVYRIPSIGGRWLPVQPITLQPRQMMGGGDANHRFNVPPARGPRAVDTVPVTFTVYGIERHVFAPMNVQIDLVAPVPSC